MIKATIESMMFGFREILTWHTMKYALLSGLIVIGIWLSIGSVVWHNLVGVSEWLLGFLPLNMMISDGAWMLSTFLWMLIVFLTFAFVYIFLGNFILTKISRQKYGAFSVILMSSSALFWLLIWFINSAEIHAKISGFLKTLPYATVEHGLATLFAAYILYNAVIISMLLMVNIFNRPLIKHLSTKHYDESVLKHHVVKSFTHTLKDAAVFMLISLLLFPVLFVPVINLMVQIVLWIWLTKDTLQYNTASLVFEALDEEHYKAHRQEIWFISFVTVLFNFVPLFNIFAPFFGEISMFHYWKQIDNSK
ncbi:MAG TPA: EI24 domain-containing protein [Campylobacterales bacterium]|nr:EI24 domain-containing protein [Campylobacterales bacterium]